MHPRAKRKSVSKEKAKQAIVELFAQADLIFQEDQEMAHRYVTLARKVQMRHKVHMPKDLKRKYCKHCYHYIRTGANGRVRIREGMLIVYCNHCKKFTRTPFKK